MIFESDHSSIDYLDGVSPLLDSFFSILSLSRIGFPAEIQNLVDSIRYIPGFTFCMRSPKGGTFYRISACHPFRDPLVPELSECDLHIGLNEVDFIVTMLSKKHIDKSQFYETFPVVLRFAQANKGSVLPRGGGWEIIGNRTYLRLFHHTDLTGVTGITEDSYLNASEWNFCGTRKLKSKHCYFTDLPSANSIVDTLPLLIRQSSGEEVAFRTDDQRIVSAGVRISQRDLGKRLSFLVDTELIQPNPMIYHFPIDGQPTWLEIEFTQIYRSPCDGIKLVKATEINGEKTWIINREDADNLRYTDPISFALGNDSNSLIQLINDANLC